MRVGQAVNVCRCCLALPRPPSTEAKADKARLIKVQYRWQQRNRWNLQWIREKIHIVAKQMLLKENFRTSKSRIKMDRPRRGLLARILYEVSSLGLQLTCQRRCISQLEWQKYRQLTIICGKVSYPRNIRNLSLFPKSSIEINQQQWSILLQSLGSASKLDSMNSLHIRRQLTNCQTIRAMSSHWYKHK